MGRDLQRSIVDRRALTFGLIGAATLPSVGRAQAFPARPIQIIVPNAAGGVNDVLARIMALKLQDQFDKPVVVENRPGAGGDIGTEGVLKAEPDGHTLVMGSISLTLKPALYKTSLRTRFRNSLNLRNKTRESLRSERPVRERRSILAPRCYARKPVSR